MKGAEGIGLELGRIFVNRKEEILWEVWGTNSLGKVLSLGIIRA